MGRPASCQCGACNRCRRNAYMREWYRRPGTAERVRTNARTSRNKRIETIRAYDRARGFRVYDPMKVIARKAAASLPKEPCEACGAKVAHAHHDDYSKPLDVRWLCPPCHGIEHRRIP